MRKQQAQLASRDQTQNLLLIIKIFILEMEKQSIIFQQIKQIN